MARDIKPFVTAIYAQSLDGYIGINNRLPWHIPKDLEHFKQVTKNGIIIMGRLTWESLPTKPLPDRINVVISSTIKELPEGVLCFKTLEDAFRSFEFIQTPIYVIGGKRIFDEALPYCKQVIKTVVGVSITKSEKSNDVLVQAPVLSSDWIIDNSTAMQVSRGYPFYIKRYIRKAKPIEDLVYQAQ